jgi:hypothetical protein
VRSHNIFVSGGETESATAMNGVRVVSNLTDIDERINAGETSARPTPHTPESTGGTGEKRSRDSSLAKLLKRSNTGHIDGF